MSVLKRKRNISKMEFYHNAIKLRLMMTKFLLRDFGIKSRRRNLEFAKDVYDMEDEDISQISGIYYPSKMDNYCKIVKGVKFYGRYMDDTYIISNSKEELKKLLDEIDKICEKLGIFINKKKTQIFRLDKGFTFLKIRYRLT